MQIMERPTLGGNPRVARAIRDALWRAESAGTGVARSELMRELTRRVRAARSHIALDVLSDEQFEELIDGVVRRSLESLGTGQESELAQDAPGAGANPFK